MLRLRSLSRGGRLLLALAVGGAVFGIASAVQASIPDASGVIHGCYNTSLAHGSPTGALRVIDTSKSGGCTAWEQPLNWSAKGPTGARGPTGKTGPTGPVGATGATGPIGPSNAYTDYGTFQSVPAGGSATLATVVLPAGRYTLSGEVRFSSTAAFPLCEFDSTATVHQMGVSSSAGQLVQMPLIGDVDVTTDGTPVLLACSLALTNSAGMTGAMIATRVGAITPAS